MNPPNALTSFGVRTGKNMGERKSRTLSGPSWRKSTWRLARTLVPTWNLTEGVLEYPFPLTMGPRGIQRSCQMKEENGGDALQIRQNNCQLSAAKKCRPQNMQNQQGSSSREVRIRAPVFPRSILVGVLATLSQKSW